MSAVHFADGFDRPERIAFGLGAPQLIVVASGALGLYGMSQASLPLAVRVPAGLFDVAVAGTLGWGRLAGLPLLTWAWLSLRFAMSPRRGSHWLVSAESSPTSSPSELAEVAQLITAGDRNGTGTRDVSADPPCDQPPGEPPWAQWLRVDKPRSAERSDAEPEPVSSAVEASPDPVPAPAASPPLQSSEVVRRVPDDDLTLELDRPPIVLLPEPVTARRSDPPPGLSERPHLSDEGTDLIDLSDDEDTAITAMSDAGAPTVISLPGVASNGATGLHVSDATDVNSEQTGTAVAAPPVFVGATRRFTFFSLNGGSGRTTLATEVACLLAARGTHQPAGGTPPQRLQVALLDLDLRSANVGIRLGIPHPTVLDYLLADDPSTLDRFLVSHACGVHALLGPPKPLGASSTPALGPTQVASIIERLERRGTHFIAIDVGADLGVLTTWVLGNVHDIYVVIRPTASGIQDVYRSTEVLRRLGLGHKLRYVVNRARGPLDVGEVMGDLGGHVVATIADDPRVEVAENAHRLVALDGSGPAAQGILALARQIYPALEAAPHPGRFSRFRRRRRG